MPQNRGRWAAAPPTTARYRAAGRGPLAWFAALRTNSKHRHRLPYGGLPAPRKSWRLEDLFGASERVWRWIRRLTIMALIVALTWYLFFLTISPFGHPNTYVVYLTAGQYQPQGAAPLAYTVEDFAALLPIEDALARQGEQGAAIRFVNIQTAQDVDQQLDALAAIPLRREDAVLICLTAHSLVKDQQSRLLTGNFEPSQTEQGSYPCARLLQRMSRLPVATKLLVLDTSRVDYEPRWGLVGNDVLRRLEEEVQAINDPQLWVLTSCSAYERSHVSPALGQSVFGYFFSRALRGAADVDQDGVIGLDEAYHFTRENVVRWARDHSDGQITQTPLLLHAAGQHAPPAERVTSPLLSTRGFSAAAAMTSLADDVAAAQRPHAAVEIAQQVAPYAAGFTQTSGSPLAPGYTPPTNSSSPRTRPAAGEREAQSTPGTPAGDSDETADSSQTSPPANATGPPDGQAASPDGPDDSPADGSADDQLPPVTPGSFPDVSQLLVESWRLTDTIAQRTAQNPAAYAPHLWRQWRHQLQWYEQLHRAGAIADQRQLADTLRNNQRTLRIIAARLPLPTTADYDDSVLTRQWRLRPRSFLDPSEVHSLALAERLVRLETTAPLLEATAALDAALRSDASKDLQEWLEQHPQLARRPYVELLLLHEVFPRATIDWPSARQALQVIRQAERVAASPYAAAGWARTVIEQGDQHRHRAERLLLDRAAADWLARSGQQFQQAAARYHLAEQQLTTVRRAQRLQRRTLLNCREYLRWHHLSRQDNAHPQRAELLQLFAGCQALGQALTATNQDVATVERAALRVHNLVQHIETSLAETELAEILTSDAAADGWRADLLLQGTLPTAPVRAQLLRLQVPRDVKFARSFQVKEPTVQVIKPQRISQQQARQARTDLELEVALAECSWFVQLQGEDSVDMWLEFIQHGEAGAAVPPDNARAAVPPDNAHSAPGALRSWKKMAQTRDKARRFYGKLPNWIGETFRTVGDLTDPATRPARLLRLRQAAADLALVDGRDVLRDFDFDLVLRQAAWFDLLTWHRHRFRQAMDDARRTEREFLELAGEHYRKLALQIPRQPRVPLAKAVELSLAGPEAISLATVSERQFDITLTRGGQSQAPAWLLLEYDHSLLEIDHAADQRIYREHQPTLAPGAPGNLAAVVGPGKKPLGQPRQGRGEIYPLRPDAHDAVPTFELDPGETVRIPLRVKKLNNNHAGTNIIVKAISGATYVRHRTAVVLPGREPIRLEVDGDIWTPTEEGVLLHPLPNRSDRLRLRLVNLTSVKQRLVAELFALENKADIRLPRGSLRGAAAESVLDRLRPLRQLGGSSSKSVPLELPPDNRPYPLQFPAPAEDAPAGEPEVVRHGLVVVLTDKETQTKIFRRIDFAPQRPQRFLTARAGYNASLERVEIEVAALDEDMVPAAGLQLVCELTGGAHPDTNIRLETQLAPPSYTAKMSAAVPLVEQRQVTAAISVDDYPRAFIFRIPCTTHLPDVRPATDLAAIRLVQPEPQAAFAAPTETITVGLQVDAAEGAFPHRGNRDYVRLGIDTDRDRELRREPSVDVFSDRQVEIRLGPWESQGYFVLHNRVSDFQLELPVVGLRDLRANLLGQLVMGSTSVWSRPVEIVLDGSGPTVDYVELGSDREVELESKLAVEIWASDAGLSGVDRVEVGFDTQGTGEFGGETPPANAQLQARQRWVAELDTTSLTPGPHTILVRATDAVGNAGRYRRVPVTLIPAGQRDDTEEKKTNAVTGIVFYAGRPLAAAEVTLTPPEPPPGPDADEPPAPPPAQPPTQTNDQGEFRFDQVMVGTYQLKAIGLARNRPRIATQEITVSPRPRPPTRVTLQAE